MKQHYEYMGGRIRVKDKCIDKYLKKCMDNVKITKEGLKKIKKLLVTDR